MVAASERVDLQREESLQSLTGKRVRVSHYLGLAVFTSLLIVILLASIPYGSVEPWSEAAFECAVFLLAALSFVEVAIDGKINWKSYLIITPVLGLIAFALIQTIPLGTGNTASLTDPAWNAISADPFQTRRWILKVLAFTLTGTMLMRYTSNERRLRVLVSLILFVGVASALFGIFRQTTQRETGFLFLTHLPKESGYGQFINRNHFAYLAEMALGLALGVMIWGEVKREKKLISLALSLPLWVGLILCNSRGGIFSMLGQILFLAALWTMTGSKENRLVGRQSWFDALQGSRPLRILLLSGLLFFILVGTVWMGGDPLVSRLESVKDEIGQVENSNQGARRKEIWRSTFSLIKDHPLAGVGYGGYWAVIPQYHDASGDVTPQEAHNDYLELLASGGLIGLILALSFFLILIKRTREVWQSSYGYRKAACLGALTGLFGVALHSLVDFGLHITINALVFTALIVIATVELQSQEKGAQLKP